MRYGEAIGGEEFGFNVYGIIRQGKLFDFLSQTYMLLQQHSKNVYHCNGLNPFTKHVCMDRSTFGGNVVKI